MCFVILNKPLPSWDSNYKMNDLDKESHLPDIIQRVNLNLAHICWTSTRGFLGICQTLGAPAILHRATPESTSQASLQAAHPAETHCLASVSFRQYFPQDDKCAANKRRQLPALSETRAFKLGLWPWLACWCVSTDRSPGWGGSKEEFRGASGPELSIYTDLPWLSRASFSWC